MAVILATGTATISRSETAILTGTATMMETPLVYVTGTATIDRQSVAAWAALDRRIGTRVFIGEEAEDLLRIGGTVSVAHDENALIPTASFTVTDLRAAFFAAGSLAAGGLPVSIRCRISTDLAETDDPVFRGTTEAAPSSGSYCPTATIQCAGEGAEWLTPAGCVSVPAFSGVSRLDILKALAESLGIDSSRIIGGQHWRTPSLGLELSGISPYDLACRFALLEDDYVRLSGGDLEIVRGRDVVGATAVPVFDFDPYSILSAAEEPPNRPVSRLVLSSVGITAEVLTGGTQEITAGLEVEVAPDLTRTETRTYTTTINGVVVRKRVEVWKDIAIPGVTPSAVGFRLWKLVETETTWGTIVIDGVTLRTSRVDSERTVTREWYSAPCRTTSGYVWSDGSRRIDSAAQWRVTDDRITTYAYDADCLLVSKTVNVGQWYSELVAVGQTYPDGSIRADNSYQWIAPDATQPWQRDTEVSAEETSDALKAVSVSTRHYGWGVPPGGTAGIEAWYAISGRDDRWSTVPGSGVTIHAWTEYREDGSTYSKSEPVSEMPALTRASASIPQYSTRPLVLDAIADAVNPLGETRSDTVWGAESMDDLTNAARHTFRRERSPRATIKHRANTHLKKLDVVAVTDPTWLHDERPGYVASPRLTFDVSRTGAADQETIVLFPLPAYDPGVPLEVLT